MVQMFDRNFSQLEPCQILTSLLHVFEVHKNHSKLCINLLITPSFQ